MATAGYCPTCGAAQPTGARFCPICGQPAGGPGTPLAPPLQPPPRARRKRSPLATALIVGFLLTVGLAVMPHTDSSSTTTGTAPTATTASRIGPTMTGDDWLALNTTDKASVAKALMDSMPNCPVAPSLLNRSLDAVYNDPTLRGNRVTEEWAKIVIIYGCRPTS